MTRRKIISSVALTALTLAAGNSARGQAGAYGADNAIRETGFLPSAAFGQLIADPGEQQFGAALRQGEFTNRGSLDGIASFGASLPVVGFNAGKNLVIQIGAAGGVIARFDMHPGGRTSRRHDRRLLGGAAAPRPIAAADEQEWLVPDRQDHRRARP